jgi:hypothetical protein
MPAISICSWVSGKTVNPAWNVPGTVPGSVSTSTQALLPLDVAAPLGVQRDAA